MNGYRVSLKEQWWDHLDSVQLGAKVQELARLGMIFTVSREESPPPKPEVRTVTEYVRVYQCPKCAYDSTSKNAVNSHRKVHAK